MNPEDNQFIQSLNCWEDNYDVVTDNIQKLSGLLSLQIQLLQNIQEEKEHKENVRHMTLEEQSISRMLSSFEQRFNVELSKLIDFSNKLDTLLTGQQVLVTRIAQIEEKLAEKEVTINSSISVKSEVGRDFDFNKVNKAVKNISDRMNRLNGMCPKVSKDEPKRVTDEEFRNRLKNIDWSKIVETKPTIRLLDDKGKVINFECQIKDDGGITCVNKDAVIIEAGLKEDRIVPNKKFITKTIDVFKQQVETNMFVYVGTMMDNVLTLNQSATVLETHITKPTTYFIDWFVKNTNPEIGCQWLNAYPSNTVNEILVKDNYTTNLVTTGYLTDEGRVIYYDQYL